MARLLPLLCLLPLVLSQVLFSGDIVDLSLTENQLASIYPIVRASPWHCMSTDFSHAQFGFNQELGISTDITWRNANTLWVVIGRLTNTAANLVKVCSARQSFFRTLGTSYNDCVSVGYLIDQGQTTFSNVIKYVHIWKHLEFICGAGFQEYTTDLECILSANQLPTATKCVDAFNATIHANPNALCSAAPSFMTCQHDFFKQYCGSWAGWTACEYERVGYASECAGLRCNI